MEDCGESGTCATFLSEPRQLSDRPWQVWNCPKGAIEGPPSYNSSCTRVVRHLHRDPAAARNPAIQFPIESNERKSIEPGQPTCRGFPSDGDPDTEQLLCESRVVIGVPVDPGRDVGLARGQSVAESPLPCSRPRRLPGALRAGGELKFRFRGVVPSAVADVEARRGRAAGERHLNAAVIGT